MHIYPSYQAPSGAAIVDFVRKNPFAIITTSTAGAPVATHAPVIFPPSSNHDETLVGTKLWGHIGRDNAHWKLFATNPQTLLVFTTSHAYISPSSYDFSPAAPTLDYAAVHLTGKVTIFETVEESLAVVEQTVEQLESDRCEQWSSTQSQPYFKRIIDGVVSFAFDVETESAMFKLSQDMPEDVHQRVCQDLMTGDHQHPDVAALMREIGVAHPEG